MAEEILRDGVVLVKRPDAKELKSILRGEWKYEQIVQAAEDFDSRLDALYQTSTLRESPDRKGIADLYREICTKYYKITL